jgi:hypothetical protein
VLANKIVLTNAVGGVSELEKLFPTIIFIEDLNAVSFCEKDNVVINGEIFNCSEIANKYIEVYREK